MKLPANALREFSWLRIVQVIVLTTIATAIIWPYFFGYDKLPFFYLWVRLFVVAVVMLTAYVATDIIYANISQPRLKLMHAQFIALVLGSVVGTLVSRLLIRRTPVGPAGRMGPPLSANTGTTGGRPPPRGGRRPGGGAPAPLPADDAADPDRKCLEARHRSPAAGRAHSRVRRRHRRRAGRHR